MYENVKNTSLKKKLEIPLKHTHLLNYQFVNKIIKVSREKVNKNALNVEMNIQCVNAGIQNPKGLNIC